MSSRAALMLWKRGVHKAFKADGRLSVMVATLPSLDTKMCSYVAAQTTGRDWPPCQPTATHNSNYDVYLYRHTRAAGVVAHTSSNAKGSRCSAHSRAEKRSSLSEHDGQRRD
jgi:hypothetical protein